MARKGKDFWTTMGEANAAFPPTRLSLLARLKQGGANTRAESIDTIVRAYWKPLYAFLRAQGHRNEDAKDLVQGFCHELVEKGHLSKYDRSRGSFRTYLRVRLRGFARDQGAMDRAVKRGGARRRVPLQEAEDLQALADRGPQTAADEAFDRAWAAGHLERAFERWKEWLTRRGKSRFLPLAELVKSGGPGKLPPIAQIARDLSHAGDVEVTEADVRHFFERDMKRLRDELFAEVSEWTSDEEDAREELAYLLRCLTR